MWNIHGMNSTFGLEFKKQFKDVELIILQETWCKADIVTHCSTGYRDAIVPLQKHRSVNRSRDSGVLIIWYKSELQNQIDPLKIDKYHIWLKLKNEIVLVICVPL
jgi:exonuclease III